ncbi:hypothetical protein Ais01nite_64240 [Asanoa ishikariensis]|uniref:Uncharacterized protein n=1 Tax=Asanoa ishikariensis TaxID=137265 RepID=A0A1H3NSS7_9ACTN|nr:hypothetical protein [Asanoa ishikariensis]GIF68389.1 hypothetical protein Ais01nite_64240 [Asanoa ishikariensis]SDY91884.1 hypothetical protein SAMN05421684_2299 [Asanoa ishikariensis]
MDYYLLSDDGVLVEEFVRAPDQSTVALRGAVWRRADARWAAASGLALRADPESLARLTPTDREGAETAYRRLGGGSLPDEAALRSVAGHEPLPIAAPLRLGPVEAPDGFHERRVYRVLFAKDLDAAPGTSHSRRIGDDLVRWTLRRVGGIAWGLDVTVLLATDADDIVGPVLRELTDTARRQGLVPVTTERFT